MNPETIKAAALAWERGRTLQQAGRYREAEPHFRAAVKGMPGSATLLADYGKLAEQLNDWKAAAQIWQAAAKADLTRPVGDRVGLALLQQNLNVEALPWLEAYAAQTAGTGGSADSAINLAVCYTRLFRDDDAIRVLRQAIHTRPKLQLAWESLATMLINGADHNGAETVLQQALARFPDSTELRYLLMDHRLKSGDFGAGFDLFDARWGTRFFGGNIKRPGALRWDGNPFIGKLLVRAEQGVGDELLYSSVFTDLFARHADTIIECDERLLPLFARSWPGMNFVPRTTPDSDPRKAGFVHDVMAGDLCRFFRRTADDFPKQTGWLHADPQRTAAIAADYRARFGNHLLVGISWRSKHPSNGTAKSLVPIQLLPLLQLPGIRFIDLQYGDTTAELAVLREQHGIEVFHDPNIDALKDIDTFAAQVSALDLVVSTSNSTVHLAGALGKATRVLLHRDHGLPWYWGYSGTRTPWYPSVELIRCPKRGDWAPAINEARQVLQLALQKR